MERVGYLWLNMPQMMSLYGLNQIQWSYNNISSPLRQLNTDMNSDCYPDLWGSIETYLRKLTA